MKDHVIPHIVENNTGKDMFEALVWFISKLLCFSTYALIDHIAAAHVKNIDIMMSYFTSIAYYF